MYIKFQDDISMPHLDAPYTHARTHAHTHTHTHTHTRGQDETKKCWGHNKGDGPDRSVSNNRYSSMTELAMKARESNVIISSFIKAVNPKTRKSK